MSKLYYFFLSSLIINHANVAISNKNQEAM